MLQYFQNCTTTKCVSVFERTCSGQSQSYFVSLLFCIGSGPGGAITDLDRDSVYQLGGHMALYQNLILSVAPGLFLCYSFQIGFAKFPL